MAAVQSTSSSEEPSSQSQVDTLGGSPSPRLHDEPTTSAVASRRGSKQPTATDLAKYGIKVRDFALESTLPPIAPVYLHPKQIQPNPGVLRPWQDNMAQSSSQAGDGRKLENHPTQSLLIQPQPSGVTRQRGFVDLRDYDTDNDELPESQDSSIYTLSQPPLSYSQTQEYEEYVKTPIVTPNGSLQWQDVDGIDLPASQLDDVLPLRLSFSQTPTRTETVHKDLTPMTPSPLSSATSSFCISPSPMPEPKTLLSKYRLRRQPSHTVRPSRLKKDQTPLIPTSPASRYYLRKRPNNATSPSTSRPVTRSRLGLSALSPLSKSKQSVAPSTPPSRRQEKADEDPSSRTFRKRSTPAVKTNGKR